MVVQILHVHYLVSMSNHYIPYSGLISWSNIFEFMELFTVRESIINNDPASFPDVNVNYNSMKYLFAKSQLPATRENIRPRNKPTSSSSTVLYGFLCFPLCVIIFPPVRFIC